ncbi:hypothetical protein JCM3766R1_004798 [Sporobolomyces carnicolor]
MPASPSRSESTATPNERLDVPVLPPSGSRFVLPPPPSDLLNRLQAFLPQIKSANEQLEQQGVGQDGQDAVEEAVVMEELSSDSDDDSDSSDSSSDDDDEDEDDDDADQAKEDTNDEEAGEVAVEAQGTLDRLMDINSRPKVVKKNLVVVEGETDSMQDK